MFGENLQMALAATVTLETEKRIQYMCTLLCGESLRQFYLLSAGVKDTETQLDVDYLLKVLVWYLFPVNSLSKQKLAMRRCMKNPRSSKVRRYAVRLIYLNEYLASFPGATMA